MYFLSIMKPQKKTVKEEWMNKSESYEKWKEWKWKKKLLNSLPKTLGHNI